MSVFSFHAGQRWVSNTESELGLGIVLEVANRRVYMSFPAAGENRTYAIDNAPLSRVRYEVGQRVSNNDGDSLLITEVEEHNGCLIYLGTDGGDQFSVLPELELNSFVQFSKPQDRLFAGQIDKNRAFELRLDTLSHYRRLQQSPVAGLLGPRIQLLPHQLYIAHEAADRYAPRVLLADEVGLGKTIEAGLIIHQQLITGRANRILIALPDSLVHQWLVEMLRRFNLFFTILDEARCEALTESGNENPFESAQLVICTLSFLSENSERLDQACSAGWDLLVVDEAHHLEWTEQHSSPAYQAIEKLSQNTRGLLLLTATPEQLGVQGHFARLRLLDPARYFDIQKFRDEEDLYAPISQLVQDLLADDGAEKLFSDDFKNRLAGVMGTHELEALNSEFEHTEGDPQKLIDHVVSDLLDRHGTGRVLFRNTRASVQGFPNRELKPYPLPAPDLQEDRNVADVPDTQGLAALLTPELQLGETWLKTDPRVAWLVDFMTQQRGQKILVICALADTAVQLEQFLNLKHGIHSAVFHEGLSLVARDRAAAYFAEQEQGAQVLVCSEIGSEGRNFQFTHQLVLFDIPLDPDLLEQRIGRLDRIGQRNDILLHVPYFQDSAQQVLLRWYHEGINAFESTCAIGHTQFRKFEAQLKSCMLDPNNHPDFDELLKKTRESSQLLLEKLHSGRDHLLELNSFDRGKADQIIADLHEHEQHHVLSAYMENVFDQFGVDQEHHSASSVILQPGEHMLGHSFPALPEDGVTATYRREVALGREEFQYLTWEHPMVTGAMDMVLSGDFGNTAFCTMRLPPFKNGAILLEAIFTISTQAPAALQLQRYLPLTTIRIVVDSKKNDLSQILTENHFRKLAKRVRRHNAQDFIRHTRAQVVTMIEQAEQLAAAQEKSIIDAARDQMQDLQTSELERLRALSDINPSIRQEEIDYLEAEIIDLQHYIDLAHIRLDALRVAVVTD